MAAVFRAAPIVHGGGYRFSGIRYGGYRAAPAFRHHHFHRRFYAPAYYDYPRYYAYPHRYCRVIWTYYGPRQDLPLPPMASALPPSPPLASLPLLVRFTLSSSWPGIAVQRTASLPLAYARPSTTSSLKQPET